MKNTTRALFAAILSGYLIVTSSVIAGSDAQATIVEIRSDKEDVTTVKVESNGIEQLIELSPEELADDALLESMLSGLDEKTRNTVMQALQGTRHMVDGSMDLSHFSKMGKGAQHKVVVINGGDGKVKHTSENVEVLLDFVSDQAASDEQKVHKMVRKHVIIDGTEGSDTTVLRGHSDVIARMINKGEFSQEELDTIQAALDSKR